MAPKAQFNLRAVEEEEEEEEEISSLVKVLKFTARLSRSSRLGTRFSVGYNYYIIYY